MNFKNLEIAVISRQGRSPFMEDFYVLNRNFGGYGWIFGGIYDGHCGHKAAKHTANLLHKMFLQKVLAGIDPLKAFPETYQEMSRQLKYQNSGTTAVNFFLQGKTLFYANAGDAKIIIIGAKKIEELTVCHRLSNPRERKRVENLGGFIKDPYLYRGIRGLMPTRTIGDEFFKPIGIIAKPAVGKYEVSENNLAMIVASDGLFDEMDNKEIAGLVKRHRNPKIILKILEKEVIGRRRGQDNLTIIAVKF
ncbi:MAG: PP2C family protein-serine/threonine phosphatase [bacterium]